MARLRCLAKWIPIPARQKFIVHCTSGAATPISDSIRSKSTDRSSPSGLLAIRLEVRLHPARAAQGSSASIQAWRSVHLSVVSFPKKIVYRTETPMSSFIYIHSKSTNKIGLPYPLSPLVVAIYYMNDRRLRRDRA